MKDEFSEPEKPLAGAISLTPTTTRTDRPDPAWVRGRCPECGEELVSHLYYKRNEGYVIAWKCFNSMGETPTCTYEKVL